MNLVDSSGWLEFFTEAPNALFFATPLKNVDELVVPTISIYEVIISVLRQYDESAGVCPFKSTKKLNYYTLDSLNKPPIPRNCIFPLANPHSGESLHCVP